MLIELLAINNGPLNLNLKRKMAIRVPKKEIAEGKRISGWSEFWLKCMYTHTSLVYELRTFEFDSSTGTCIQFQ